MRSRAPERPLVQTRLVQPADEDLLRRLFAQSREDLALLPDELRGPLVEMQYAARRDQRVAAHPGAEHLVLQLDGVDVGAMVVDRSGPQVWLVDLEVATSHRRRGVARAAVSGLLDEAAGSGRPVRLHVWSDNRAARALYAQLGFEGPSGQGHLELVAIPTTSRRARRV